VPRPTVIVLDNASIHTAASVQLRRAVWETRDLYLFFLPPYSPHLNIAETVWRQLKGGWLCPEDYAQPDDLAYATNR
jgi:transposase